MKKKIILGFCVGLFVSLGICRRVYNKYIQTAIVEKKVVTEQLYNMSLGQLGLGGHYIPRVHFNRCDTLGADIFPTFSGKSLCHEAGAIINVLSGGVSAVYFGGVIDLPHRFDTPEDPFDFVATIVDGRLDTRQGDKETALAYLVHYRNNIAGITSTYPGGKELLEKRRAGQTDIIKEKLGFDTITFDKPFEKTEGIKNCVIQRASAPIIDISTANKLCNVTSAEGYIPSGLGGADFPYIISAGKVYGAVPQDPSIPQDISEQCLYGGTSTNPYPRSLSNLETDPSAKYISNFKNKNYLTYYGGTLFVRLTVFPSLMMDTFSGSYTEGYLDNTNEKPVFVVDDIIYDPWDLTMTGNSSDMHEEAYQNNQTPHSKSRGTYNGPWIFMGKNNQGKIMVARQENVQISYDVTGKPKKKLDSSENEYLVNYKINTCTLQ